MTSRSVRTFAVAATSVALLLSAGCSSSDEEAQEGEFSLLSYNVAGLPQEISDEQPSIHLPLISPQLADFDLVLTQEDFDWWGDLAADFDFVNYHQRLWADAGHEHRTGAHPGPDAVGLDTEIRPAPEVGDGLAVGSRFPLGDVERVPWVGCFGGFDTSDGGAADCLAMKGFLHTTVTLADGIEVDLYDLHGEAGGTSADQELQADDFDQLAAYIAEHSADRAVIIAGDTNLHTDDEHPDGSDGADTRIWKKFLEATGLTDACEATDCGQPGRIDKAAFRSSEAIELEAVSHAFHEWRDDDGEELSDHQPLEVHFRWRHR